MKHDLEIMLMATQSLVGPFYILCMLPLIIHELLYK